MENVETTSAETNQDSLKPPRYSPTILMPLLSDAANYDYECGIFSKRLKNLTRSCGGKSLV